MRHGKEMVLHSGCLDSHLHHRHCCGARRWSWNKALLVSIFAQIGEEELKVVSIRSKAAPVTASNYEIGGELIRFIIRRRELSMVAGLLWHHNLLVKMTVVQW